MTIQVGDWIRYRCGWRQMLVLDEVIYVTTQIHYPYKPEAVTIHNRVTFDEVLEVRRAVLDRAQS